MLKFKKTSSALQTGKEPEVPKGLWIKCDACGELLYKEDVKQNHYVCYKCGKYFRITTKKRLRMVMDKGSYEKWEEGMVSVFELMEKRNLYIQAKAELARTRLQYDLKHRMVEFYRTGSFLVK